MTKRPVLLTLLAVAAIVVFPLVLLRNDSSIEFGGADGQAADEVSRIDPDHSPWFEPLWSPPGGETESLLFALQAALGAGVLGYVIGSIRTRHRLTSAPETGNDDDRGGGNGGHSAGPTLDVRSTEQHPHAPDVRVP